MQNDNAGNKTMAPIVEGAYWPVEYAKLIARTKQQAAILLKTTPDKVYAYRYQTPAKVRFKIVETVPLFDNSTIISPLSSLDKNPRENHFNVTHLCRCDNPNPLFFTRTIWYIDSSFWKYQQDGIICVKHGDLFRLQRYFDRSGIIDLPCPILDPAFWENLYRHTIGFLKLRKKLRLDRIKINRGLVLHGSPGNGKTMFCNWLAAQSTRFRIPVVWVSSNALVSSYKNESLYLLLDNPIVIFDDIDISFFCRQDGANAEICCGLLAALDGQVINSQCSLRIFATNEDLSKMDAAFLRPGRIDAVMTFSPPTAELRHRIINTWHKDAIVHIDVEKLVRQTEGWSGAEINAIRDFMILHYYEKGEWNLSHAINQTIEARPDIAATKMGFMAE